MYVRPTFFADALPNRLGLVAPEKTPSRAGSVADLVMAAAAEAPGAPALISGEARLTYGELAARVDRLGEYLRRLHLGPAVPVGICLDRSFDRIVAMLAVWRAGACFLPLDPAWPAERITRLVEDAEVSLVIAEPEPAALFTGMRVALVLGRIADAVACCTPRANPVAIDPEATAYLLPGRDVGTKRVTHATLVDWVLRRRQAMAASVNLRAVHAAAPASEAGITELWPHLAAGARVILSDDPREPHTAGERRLAEIVAFVLELDHADLDQDLVPLWEDETRAAQAVLMIRADFGVSLSAHDLAAAPTVDDLAAVVEAHLNATQTDGEVREA